MRTGRKAVGHFLFWLLLGVAAGVFLAAVLSYHECHKDGITGKGIEGTLKCGI